MFKGIRNRLFMIGKMRKWQWLEKKSLEIGNNKGARIANKIDSIVKSYYPFHTQDWINYYLINEKIWKESNNIMRKISHVDRVATSSSFCSPCSKHFSSGCEGCKFGKAAGRCVNWTIKAFNGLLEERITGINGASLFGTFVESNSRFSSKIANETIKAKLKEEGLL